MSAEMTGYDKQAAMQYIPGAIDMSPYKILKDDAPLLMSTMIEADMAYMHLYDAPDKTGDTGEGSYDEDDAFLYILSALLKDESANGKKEEALASLINDFMPAQSLFLGRSGLVTTDQT